MEVTHLDHTNTHAIIGGMAPESFGVEDNAEFYEMLSSTMYPNKKLAVVREVLCNNWDAHLMVGKTDTFVEVTIDDKEMAFKDFGPGIERSKIIKIYCTYGSSTKSHDGKQTGGFGLGSKAPFAYSKHFTVVSCHNGLRTIYAASRGSAETKGKPDFRPMVADLPTDETGITVTIPLHSRDDRQSFEELVRDLAYLGGMKVKLNGKELPRFDYEKAEWPLVIMNHHNIGRHHGHSNGLYVRYGAVVYPVGGHDEEIEAALKAAPFLKSLSASYAVVLLADPDTIGVAPSRETLSYTPKTVKTVVDLIKRSEACFDQNKAMMRKEVDRMISESLAAIKENPITRFKAVVEAGDIFDLILNATHNRTYRMTGVSSAATAHEIRRVAVLCALARHSKEALVRMLDNATDAETRSRLKLAIRLKNKHWNRYFNQMEFGAGPSKRREHYGEKVTRAGRTSLAYDLEGSLERMKAPLIETFKVRLAFGYNGWDGFSENEHFSKFVSNFAEHVISHSKDPSRAVSQMNAIFSPSRDAASRYIKASRLGSRKENPTVVVLTKASSDIEGAMEMMKKFGFQIHDASSFVVQRKVILPSPELYMLQGVHRRNFHPRRVKADCVSDQVYDPATSTAKCYCYGTLHEVAPEVFWVDSTLDATTTDWALKNLGEVVVIFNAADARNVTQAGLRSVHEEIADRIVQFAETETGAASLLVGTNIIRDEMRNIRDYFNGDYGKSLEYMEAVIAPIGGSTLARHNATDEQKEIVEIANNSFITFGVDGVGKFGSQFVVKALRTAREAIKTRYARVLEILGSEEFANFQTCFNSYYAHRMNSAILVSVLSAAAQAAAVQIALKPKTETEKSPAIN